MSERIISAKRSAVFVDLKELEYSRALACQIQARESKIHERLTEDQIFFVEHPSVFTLGKRGGEENLVVSRSFLNKKKITMVQTDRGGNITYHGPGQAVLYPIVDLEKNRIGVKDFVYGLEEIMKRTTREFGIDADRNERNHGLWVRDSKIGSVGISVKKSVSFHGLALNVTTDLEPFSWINPCGMAHVRMTSIEKEIDPCLEKRGDLSMNHIKKLFVKHFSSVFDFTISKLS